MNIYIYIYIYIYPNPSSEPKVNMEQGNWERIEPHSTYNNSKDWLVSWPQQRWYESFHKYIFNYEAAMMSASKTADGIRVYMEGL